MERLSKTFILFILFCFGLSCQTSGTKTLVYLVKVEPGDSIISIAKQFDTSWQKIAALNDLSEPYVLNPGMTLRVAPGKNGMVHQQPAKTLKKKRYRGLLFRKATSGKLRWPVSGKITSYYGKRWGRFHHGIDIKAPGGTNIRAALAGKVIFSGRQRGYGRTLIVQHENIKTLYAHCSRLLARKGDRIELGQRIALVGRTGNASGTHLHFEVRNRRDRSINPLSYLQKPSNLTAFRAVVWQKLAALN